MKEKKDHQFIKKPIYPGGNTAFRQFIYSNLKYPKEALDNRIEGIIICRYEIDYKGNVDKVKIKKGIGYGCDEEARRIVKLLKWEIPKEPRKLRVSFQKETKIKFELPKEKSTMKLNQSSQKVSYTITSKPKKITTDIDKKDHKKTSYTYTIQF